MLTLVTGATGLLGNNVVRMLLQRGQRVRVFCLAGADRRPLDGLDVERVEGDVQNAESVRRACRGVERVVHAAALVHIGWRGIECQRRVNVEGTRNVATAAREAGARLVHVSTVDTLAPGSRTSPADEESAPNGQVPCPYVVTKRAGERLVLDMVRQGLDAVVVNPVYMLGPWDWRPSSGRMLLAVAHGHLHWAPAGGNDFCDARDVAAGVLLAAERGETGRRYILGGEAMSYLEAWRLFADVTGVTPPSRAIGGCSLSRGVVHALGLAGTVYGWLTGCEPDLNSAATRLALVEHHFSAALACRELGYAPRPVRQAAESAWNWFLQHGYR
jgi:dihydroflavonol-4-reductase